MSEQVEQTYLFSVKMHCGGCSGAVERALKKIGNISSYDISLEKQEVKVTGTVPFGEVEEKIKKTGKEVISGKVVEAVKETVEQGGKPAGGEQTFAEWQKEFEEGEKNFAEGEKSFAEGEKSFAEGEKSFAEGEKRFEEREEKISKELAPNSVTVA